jgi:hypothetical protein
MRRTVFGILLAAFAGLLFSSCASSTDPQDPSHVSNIPWNRPESWEGKGPLGGMTPGSQ